MDEKSKQIKVILKEMFAWFHAFCAEHDLRYYMLGGTMLGAVRHQGFIPWDDDIDVGMPREDYNKLAELLAEHKSEKYILETPNSDSKEYLYPISKLYDINTTLIENTRYKIKRGVYLDIFPLDGTGNTKEESDKYYRGFAKRLNFLLAMTTGIRKGRSVIKNLFVLCGRFIPNFVIDRKYYLRKINEDASKKDFFSYKYGGNIFGAWREKEIMPVEYMGTPTIYEFEGMKVYGVEKYDEYLTRLYGNWRELPPIEKRVSHHDFVLIELEKSYLN